MVLDANVTDLRAYIKKLEGKVLPAPALGELESLMVCPPSVPAFDVFAFALGVILARFEA